jgi:Tfp pilus assembly protein PilZ
MNTLIINTHAHSLLNTCSDALMSSKILFSSLSHSCTHFQIKLMSSLYSAYMIILKTTSLDCTIAQQA